MASSGLLYILSHSSFIFISIMAGIVVRWSVGAGPYSGMGKSPMYGDYEAQRHWQEVTINTPINEWYKNTSDNDLLYWGLDYPPITAYHSWLIGKIARLINPEWVELGTSRGMESYDHKLFMRYTVLVADILIFLPALYLAHKSLKTKQVNREAFLVSLFYPGLILIDYGHFQYNNISLGLFLFASYLLSRNHDLFGSVAYCLALNYKQMELYHSLPFFCFLLGRSLEKGIISGFFKVVKLGFVVLATFGACWSPFLSSQDDVLAVLTRLFPVNRGLYEDKVANFWCAISPVIKLKDLISSSDAVTVCIVATLLASVPSALHLLIRPTIRAFNFSCVAVPLSFYLFSYQVHEKSILIPAVSAFLLYTEAPFLVAWFLYISTFSMGPLLLKDGLMIQFLATRLMFLILMYGFEFETSKPSRNMVNVVRGLTCNIFHTAGTKRIVQFMVFFSIILAELLSLLMVFVKPPVRYPDLWPVAVSIISCAHFLFFLVIFTAMQFRDPAQAMSEAKKKL